MFAPKVVRCTSVRVCPGSEWLVNKVSLQHAEQQLALPRFSLGRGTWHCPVYSKGGDRRGMQSMEKAAVGLHSMELKFHTVYSILHSMESFIPYCGIEIPYCGIEIPYCGMFDSILWGLGTHYGIHFFHTVEILLHSMEN